MSEDDWGSISSQYSKKGKKKQQKKRIREEDGEKPVKKSFSSMMTTPIVTLKVSQDSTQQSESWYVHLGLLSEESEKLCMSLPDNEDFHAGTTLQVVEEPSLFGYFIDYLYCKEKTTWTIPPLNQDLQAQKHRNTFSAFGTQPINNDKEAACVMVLARLYVMARRLNACRFQTTILLSIRQSLKSMKLDTRWIVRLLRIVAIGMPILSAEDPLRKSVLLYTIKNLEQLQISEGFAELLRDTPDLAIWVCLHAGTPAKPQPEVDNIVANVEYYAREPSLITEELELVGLNI